MMYSLREVLESKNIAVIGASSDPFKPGAMLLKVLRDTGYAGRFAGINPKGGEVYGVPFYRGLNEVPFQVHLAAIIIHPRAMGAALKDCAQHGVKGVVISSEGFAETGEEGRRYQNEVREILKTTGMRGFGPNTMGIVNTATGLTTAYFANSRMLRPGHIGFAAQSGIFVGAFLRYLSSFEEFRVSKAMGLGNKVDVDESDVLEFFAEDPQTEIAALYVEDIRDGRRFLEAARRAVPRKPILLLKGGRTAAGARATASHTASLAVNDRVLEGALRQTGILRVRGIDELMATLLGFRCMPLPRGNRIALVTFSGAQAIMSIDAAMDEGLDVARFSQATRDRLAELMAAPSKAMNPIDIYPDMMVHGFEKLTTTIMKALLEDEDVHGIVFISFSTPSPEPYQPLVDLITKRRSKPVFFTLLGERKDTEALRAFLEQHRLPFCAFPEMAVRAFAQMRRYAATLESL
jgi:acetyltransferase